MIDQIHVENFKPIADATIDLSPLHLLIAPNDSGKTSFLEAIAALSRSLDHPISQAFLGCWVGRQLVNSRSTQPTVTIEGRISGEVSGLYRLECEFLGSNSREQKSVLVKQAVWNEGQAKLVSWNQETLTGNLNREGASKRQFFDDGEKLAKQICPCWYLRWSARNMALPATLDPDRYLRLAGNGFGLPVLLDDLLSGDRARFDAVEAKMRELFPTVRRLELRQEKGFSSPIDDPEQTLHLQTGNGKQIYFVLNDSAEIPASQAAEGMLYALGYLAILHLPNPPRILLVEEPENGIHPARVVEIIKLLRQLVREHPGTQVVMASHSPYLVDEMLPEEVTWCRRDKDDRIITERLDRNETVKRQKSLFELGEIWSNYLDPLSGVSSE